MARNKANLMSGRRILLATNRCPVATRIKFWIAIRSTSPMARNMNHLERGKAYSPKKKLGCKF
jgi:hypothetical protein